MDKYRSIPTGLSLTHMMEAKQSLIFLLIWHSMESITLMRQRYQLQFLLSMTLR